MFFAGAAAQSWQWDTLSSSAGKLCKDGTGGYYKRAHSAGNALVERLTGSGKPKWIYNFPPTVSISGFSAAADTSLYVTGIFSDSLAVPGTTLHAAGQSRQDIFLARISPQGSLQWVRQIGGVNYDGAGEVAAYPGNRVVLTGAAGGATMNMLGQTIQADSMNQYFIAMADAQGNLLNHVMAGSSVTTCASAGMRLAVDRQGNIFSTLQPFGTVSIGAATFTNSYGVYLLKMDPSLNTVWSISVTAASYMYGPWMTELACDHAGDILFTEESSWHYGHSASLTKYSSAGQLIGVINAWQPVITHPASPYAGYGTSTIHSFDTDSCSNIYLSLNNTMHSYSGMYYDSKNAVVRFSPSLTMDWIHIDSLNTRNYYSYWNSSDISVISPNFLFVTGMFGDTLVLHDTLLSPPGAITGAYYAKFSAVMSPPSNATPPGMQVICPGTRCILSANAAGTINWYPSLTATTSLASGMSFTTPVLPPGSYTYYADASTCTTTTGRNPITFTVTPGPSVTVNSGTVCSGKTFTFIASGALSYTYPMVLPKITPPSSTVYTVYGADVLGCISSAQSSVTVLPAPQLNIICLNNICTGQQVQLTGSGAVSFTWHTGHHGPQLNHTPLVSTTYSLSGTGQNGCEAMMSVAVNVEACAGLGADDMSGFKIFPVPAADHLYVVADQPAACELIASDGRIVISLTALAGKSKLNVSGLPRGIYIFRITQPGRSSTRTILLQ